MTGWTTRVVGGLALALAIACGSHHRRVASPQPARTATETLAAARFQQPDHGECTEGLLPDFPSPIPTPSARMALPGGLMARARSREDRRLADAADELDRLLLTAGYSERAYFRLRDEDQTVGFALVTRIERIRTDGSPFPTRERFLPFGTESDRFDLVGFLKSLFVAPVGYYRVLVFTVSRAPLRAAGPQIGARGAERWLSMGSTRLLGCVAGIPLTDDFGVDVLVYEFRHAPEAASDRRVSQLIPSTLDPAVHLNRAGIIGDDPPR